MDMGYRQYNPVQDDFPKLVTIARKQSGDMMSIAYRLISSNDRSDNRAGAHATVIIKGVAKDNAKIITDYTDYLQRSNYKSEFIQSIVKPLMEQLWNVVAYLLESVCGDDYFEIYSDRLRRQWTKLVKANM